MRHSDHATSRVVISHLLVVVLQTVLFTGPTLFPELWATLPSYLTINASVVILASATVYAGCYRSIKPQYEEAETLTTKDAVKFPFIGSAVLLSIFFAYKYLNEEYLNLIVKCYFAIAGTYAIAATLEPLALELAPAFLARERLHLRDVSVPYLLAPSDVRLSILNVGVYLGAANTSLAYFRHQSWGLNNVLGLAFALSGIEILHLGSVSTGVVLLIGLFFYDIIFVFYTPVMVTVAKKFNGPIKLMFAKGLDVDTRKLTFSILGLGDIVLPGTLMSMMLKLDASRGFQSSYFRSTMIGYILGLITTVLVMVVFQAAQPALLYLVPGVVGAILLHAAARGEVTHVLQWSAESGAVVAESEDGADVAIAKDPAEPTANSKEARRTKKTK